MSLADFAARVVGVRPTVRLPGGRPLLQVELGHHPCLVLRGADFIPNDVTLGRGASLVLVTGPNMGGKSTLMRQTALLCILAQIVS